MRAWLLITFARLAGFLRPGAADRDFDDELAAHLALAEDAKVRAGLSRAEARRAARVELGGVAQLREAGRAARGLPRLDALRLDVTLGWRRLRKDWVLTLVGGLAMATAIAIVVGMVNTHQALYEADLPLDDGDRVMALMAYDTATRRPQDTPLGDVARWRAEARSFADVSAFRTVERGLVPGGDGPAEPVSVAEMTASGFALARVAALLGRVLAPDDETPGAAPVVVIGFEPWQTLFAGDRAVLGRTVTLGGRAHTVVGVMPEGFAFPVNHRYWVPLAAVPRPAGPDGPDVTAFARLAPGATQEGAQAELAALGLLPAPGLDGTDDRRAPRVIAYSVALNMGGGDYVSLLTAGILLTFALLLVPPCANVAILVYARAVARQEEFAARYALGASRGRIVGQVFVELLVLATGATLVALLAVRLAGEFMQAALPDGPFWLDFRTVAPRSIVVAAGLAVVAALIAGLVPALRATGRLLATGLRTPGDRATLPLGVVWTTLIVVQVALSLAALPLATQLAWGTMRGNILGPGFPVEQYLTARLFLDAPEGSEAMARAGRLRDTLVGQLEDEPGVSAVVISSDLPGAGVPARIESPAVVASIAVAATRVGPAYFDTLEMPLLTGRAFDLSDAARADAVVVNRTLADLLGGDVLGTRIRHVVAAAADAPEPWHEVVGVVDDLDANAGDPVLYHPLPREAAAAPWLTVRLTSEPTGLAPRLRALAGALDPALRVDSVAGLAAVYRERSRIQYLGGVMIGSITLSVLLLSAAGMYALMSFTVNRRRREIGIRTALGAAPGPLLAGVFRRASRQLLAGATIGGLLAPVLTRVMPLDQMGGAEVPFVVPAAAALMLAVGLLAAIGPARRALAVDPTATLRND